MGCTMNNEFPNIDFRAIDAVADKVADRIMAIKARRPMKTASWVIIRKATGEAVMETFSLDVVGLVNRDKYEVKPILEYLQGLNRKP